MRETIHIAVLSVYHNCSIVSQILSGSSHMRLLVVLTRSLFRHNQIVLPLISGRREDRGAMLHSPDYPSALSLSLVHHQHLISIQGVRLLYVCTLHAQWVHEQRAGSEWGVVCEGVQCVMIVQ